MIFSFDDVIRFQKELFDACSYSTESFQRESESVNYYPCFFLLNGKHVRLRVARATPAKTGQFVTLWKRGKDQKALPFDCVDEVDFLVVVMCTGKKIGQFVFPKRVLIDKNILSVGEKGAS